MRSILSLSILVLGFCTSGFAANKFVDAGVPSPSREWYGPEYTRAAAIFAAEGAVIPTHDGADGEKVFARLISVANFSLARNRTIPLSQRMEDALAMQLAANSILKKYVNEANRGANLNREVAEQLVFSLQMAAEMLALVDEFLPTIKKDEKYGVRIEGLNRMKMAMETVFSGAEESLGERHFYSDADISIMLSAMAETLPRFKTAFSADFRSELQLRLKKRASEFRTPDALEKFKTMQNELAN